MQRKQHTIKNAIVLSITVTTVNSAGSRSWYSRSRLWSWARHTISLCNIIGNTVLVHGWDDVGVHTINSETWLNVSAYLLWLCSLKEHDEGDGWVHIDCPLPLDAHASSPIALRIALYVCSLWYESEHFVTLASQPTTYSAVRWWWCPSAACTHRTPPPDSLYFFFLFFLLLTAVLCLVNYRPWPTTLPHTGRIGITIM